MPAKSPHHGGEEDGLVGILVGVALGSQFGSEYGWPLEDMRIVIIIVRKHHNRNLGFFVFRFSVAFLIKKSRLI